MRKLQLASRTRVVPPLTLNTWTNTIRCLLHTDITQVEFSLVFRLQLTSYVHHYIDTLYTRHRKILTMLHTIIPALRDYPNQHLLPTIMVISTSRALPRLSNAALDSESLLYSKIMCSANHHISNMDHLIVKPSIMSALATLRSRQSHFATFELIGTLKFRVVHSIIESAVWSAKF